MILYLFLLLLFSSTLQKNISILSLTTGFIGAIYWLFTPKFHQIRNNMF